jgi:molybdate transport system substrate-binding protein
MKLIVFILSVWVFFIGIGCSTVQAADITVAAASDLNDAIKEIISVYEADSGNHVRLTLGSSGNFFAQIANGAPFDVFLSADAEYPRQLEKAGLTQPGTISIYAIGQIAVWVPRSSKVDVQKLGMKALMEPSIRKISIANPEHAPYGRAAVAAMERASVYSAVRSKLVLGENVSQAAQFVQSGAADVGVVALSVCMSAAMKKAGRHWVVPRDMYPRMEQAAVLLKRAGPEARQFHEMVRSATARKIFEKYGFVQ